MYDRTSTFGDGKAVHMVDEAVVAKTRLHIHNFLECAYVRAGSGHHLYGTRLERIVAGDIMLINPSIPHCFIAHAGHPLRIWTVAFTETALEGLLGTPEMAEMLGLFSVVERDGSGVPALRVASTAHPEELLAAMLAEYREEKPGCQLVLRGYLAVLLTELWRVCAPIMHQGTKSVSWRRLSHVVQRLYEEAGSARVGELARQLGWTPDHFSRMFRNTTGQTPREFMRRLRTHRAAMLLLTTDQPVDSVAQEVGYSSARALRQAFTACFGITPQEYRSLTAKVTPQPDR